MFYTVSDLVYKYVYFYKFYSDYCMALKGKLVSVMGRATPKTIRIAASGFRFLPLLFELLHVYPHETPKLCVYEIDRSYSSINPAVRFIAIV